jgi:hypothetical protein
MPAITTVLTEYSDNGNSRTYSVAGHTAVQPFLVVEKRVAPASADGSTELSFRIVKGTTDTDGAVIAARQSAEVIVRRPYQGDADDATAVFNLLKEIVASDEFAASVGTLNFFE